MLKLISKSPLNGMKPIKVGSLVLSEITSVNMFTIQPFKNKTKTVSKELKKLFHLELPGDGKSLVAKDNTIMWIGMGQYLFLGNKVESISAAITDQSDAWTVVELAGIDSSDVMDRLCPVDVRSMEVGDVIRSLLGHMATIVRKTDLGYELMVFRSFSKTLVHEIEGSMKSIAAQNKLRGL